MSLIDEFLRIRMLLDQMDGPDEQLAAEHDILTNGLKNYLTGDVDEYGLPQPTRNSLALRRSRTCRNQEKEFAEDEEEN